MPRTRIAIPYHVDVETGRGQSIQVTFCAKRLVKASKAPMEEMAPHLADLLRWHSRVPDAWRYSFSIQNGRVNGAWKPACGRVKLALSDFPNDIDMTAYRGGLNIILLVLESPHVSEFQFCSNRHRVFPKGPAQGRQPGDAGGAIERQGLEVLDLLAQQFEEQTGTPLPDAEYALVLVNPIPYLTSLHWMDVLTRYTSAPSGPLKKSVRNHVWTQLWNVPDLQNDFIRRCEQYAPVAILNCCTSTLKAKVTCSLSDAGFADIIYAAFHPAYNWQWGISNATRPITVRRAICSR